MSYEVIGWLIAIVVFIAAEAATVALVSVWFIGGAVCALAAAILGAGLAVQLAVFLAVSAVLLAFVCPIARKKWTKKPERMNAKIAIDCAREGDRAALEVFHNYVDHLGSAVASMINLLDCERVAIGGGVSAAGEFLFEPLRKNVHAKSFFENHGSVVPAVMGNDAGIIGAAMLRRNEE